MKKIEDLKDWQEGINQVLHGDCLDLMRMMPDKCVDLVLTDPPYELDSSTPGVSSAIMSLKKFNDNKYKSITTGFDIDIVFGEIERISKKMNMFCFCSNRQISKIMAWGEERGYFTTCLVWNKTNAAPFANGVWRSDAEFCIHIRGKGATFQGNAEEKRKVVPIPINTSRFKHPTEKPLKLIQRYMAIGSNDGDLVFDPFGGSFTTARAAKDLGRNFLACDREEDYCRIGEERLRQECLF